MDEAGRGPVMGPLVIGLVVSTENQVRGLRKEGVMDSKVLKKEVREELFSFIKTNCSGYGVLSISAEEIDRLRAKGYTLNEIEVMGFKELLSKFVIELDDVTLQLDAADVNAKRFGQNFTSIFKGEIVSKHKADVLFPSVSAASILAKVVRDARISTFQEEMLRFDPNLPTMGSGYPNKISTDFLRAYFKKYQKYPDFVRNSWETAKKIKIELSTEQKSLSDFF